jgi:hypothetical protein
MIIEWWTYEGVCGETASTLDTVFAIFVLLPVGLLCDSLIILGELFQEPCALLFKFRVRDCTIFAFVTGSEGSASTRVWIFDSSVLLLKLLVLSLLILKEKVRRDIELVEVCK